VRLTPHTTIFSHRCEEAGEVSVALLYDDLSSSYATLTKRFCTPKGMYVALPPSLPPSLPLTLPPSLTLLSTTISPPPTLP